MSVDPKRAQLLKSYKETFDSESGRAVLRDLARFCAIGVPITVQSDAVTTYGLECSRRVFWYIYQLLYYDRTTAAAQKAALPLDFTIDPFSFEPERNMQ